MSLMLAFCSFSDSRILVVVHIELVTVLVVVVRKSSIIVMTLFGKSDMFWQLYISGDSHCRSVRYCDCDCVFDRVYGVDLGESILRIP